MVPSVPTSKMSSGTGSFVLAFFWATSRISFSCPIASSRAAIDFSRPTKSGTTMCGKTMMSRRGRRGSCRVRGLPPFFSSLPKNILWVTSCGFGDNYSELNCAPRGRLPRTSGQSGGPFIAEHPGVGPARTTPGGSKR